MSNLEDIERLAKLRESGVLTEEEFQEKKKEILSTDVATSKTGGSSLKQLTEEERRNLSIFNVHKIKKPKEYGGWSNLVLFWFLIPIIGAVFGIVGMRSDNEIKQVQGKTLLISSILLFLVYYFKSRGV